MPSITIGTISKKLNSTYNTFSGTNLTCKLKDVCGMQSPVFEVQGLSKGTFYNYAKFEGRYYWINEIAYLTNNIQVVHCSIDALATFKDAIKNSYGLVVYGDSSHWSKLIDDVRLEPEMRYSTQTIANENMFGLATSSTGCVAMTYTQTCSLDWLDPNAGTIPGTGVHTALLSVSEMRECIGDLTGFDPGQGLSGSGMLELLEAFGRVIQSLGGGSLADYIQRIIWLPFDLTTLASALGATYKTGMMIGGVLADQCNYYEINPGNIYAHNGNFTIDWSTLTGGNDFLKNSRWISLQVYTPGGFQDIPMYCAKYANTLYYRCTFSVTDGSWNMRLCADSNMYDTLTTFSGNISVDLLGTVNLGNQFSGTIADAGASFVGGALAMGIGSIATGSAVGSVTTTTTTGNVATTNEFNNGFSGSKNEDINLTQTTTHSGISGSLPKTNFSVRSSTGQFSGAGSLFLTTTPASMIIYAQCYMPYTLGTYTDFCNLYGYPCNRYLKIGDCTGFVQCAGASVQGASGATPSNLSTINSFLNSGIYIE